jgi:hypothetical protein
MAVILKINDLVVCWKIHGCGWVDDPVPRKSRLVHNFILFGSQNPIISAWRLDRRKSKLVYVSTSLSNVIGLLCGWQCMYLHVYSKQNLRRLRSV